MTREEFLQGLKEALDGNMDASAIQENLNYYNEYINEEVRKGKTEQQVVDTREIHGRLHRLCWRQMKMELTVERQQAAVMVLI